MDTPDTGTRPGSPVVPDWLTTEVWPFPTRRLTVAGRGVAVTDVGEGPVLLFCHAGQWSFLWRDLVAALADRYRCVTFDPPGFGLSDRVPADDLTLEMVGEVIGGIIDDLDLRDVTLVMHDLGGVTALAAAASRAERVVALAAVNTFGWRPSGVLFRTMLTVFGSAWMRGLDGVTGFLPRAASTRLGVGRHLDRRSRAAFRRGMDARARRGMHRLFAAARRSPDVYRDAELAHRSLAGRPLLMVFGAWGDYLRFRRRWRVLYPSAREVTVPHGLHFPMSDDPRLVADAIAGWHLEVVGPRR